MSLETADAELARWRDRLAAASRNVSELSELPEYGAAKAAAAGTGRVAAEARGLVATMDELWQGVLLIGAALDRAEQARRSGTRLWRGEEAAQQAMAILHGESITVDLADTPVLHRRLLAGPRATVTVSPDTLLRTMDAAFDRARETLTRITQASQRSASLQAALAAAVARLPPSSGLAEALAQAGQRPDQQPDPLDHLDALEALRPRIERAIAVMDQAGAALARAQSQLGTLQAAADAAQAAEAACRAAVQTGLPAPGQDALRDGVQDAAAWLQRIGLALTQGKPEAALKGLASWQLLHDRVRAECDALARTATAALARRDELAARLRALHAKHQAKAPPGAAVSGDTLERLAASARMSLSAAPVDLAAAERDVAAYGAALARH